jgi:Ca-activated chloride channel family protein
MQLLADKGNGNHSFIDNENEARKVLVQEFGSTLFTIAKDVKIQVEFNPAIVQGYRLIGYENRLIEAADFRDDRKDAGELGSGHTVTALYEIIPAGIKSNFMRPVDSLQFQEPKQVGTITDELAVMRLRYKLPEGDSSMVLNSPIENRPLGFSAASENFRFASAVAGFGLLLRKSPYCLHGNYVQLKNIAANAKGKDQRGLRKQFVDLVNLGAELSNK